MTLGYDALGRLASTTVSGTGVTQFLYDGDALVGEYNAGGGLLRRYVHGPGVDEPLVWYEGAALSDRRHLHADERGSIVAVSDAGGNASSTYAYGPYGEPGVWPGVRFRYTGQIVLPEVGLYHYKARAYSPRFGRFLQSDPIGTRDDMNMYAYVGNDPVNGSDPSGLANTGYSDSSFSLTGGTQLAENVAAPAFGAGVTYTDVGRGLLTAGNIIVDAVSTAAAATVAGVGAVGAILLYPNTTADPAHDEYHGGGTIMNNDNNSRPPFQGTPGGTVVTPNQGRTYGSDGYPSIDVDIGHNHNGAGDPHAHDWSRPADGSPPSAPNRGPARPIQPGDPVPQPKSGN